MMEAAKREMNSPVCIICEEEQAVGMYIYTSFICRKCENDIIHTDTGNPVYQYYLDKLKKVRTPESYS